VYCNGALYVVLCIVMVRCMWCCVYCNGALYVVLCIVMVCCMWCCVL